MYKECMKKVFNSFKGMIPKQNQKLLGNGYAYHAKDILIDRGFISPMRTNKLIRQAGSHDKVIVEHYGNIFTFTECVNTTSWLVDCPRIYLTGRREYMEVAHITANNQLNYYRVGLPTPENVVKIISQVNYDNKDENSYYSSWVFTFVNDLGEESSPSPASDIFLHTDGQEVDLEIKYSFSSTYNNIVGINLYRASTGFTTGGEKEQTQETEYLYVKTYPISLNNTELQMIQVKDNFKMLDLGWVLSTREAQEPPIGLRGVILLTDSTVLCAYKGNKLYFSEPDEPHNWREEQEITLEDNIINIKELGGVLYVMTDGKPYYIDVSRGCNGRECRAVIKDLRYLPAIACDGQNSPIVSEYGVLYVSTEGMIALNKGQQPKILTEEYFSQEQWRRLEPQKIKLRVYQGEVYILTSLYSEIGATAYKFNPINKQGVIMTSDDLCDATVSRTGEFIGLRRYDKAIIHLFAGDGYRKGEWVSELLHDKKDRFNVFRYEKDVGEASLKIRDEYSSNFVGLTEDMIASNYDHLSTVGRVKRYYANSGVRLVVSTKTTVYRLILGYRMSDLTSIE